MKLVCSQALTIRTRRGNDEFGDGTKELGLRNPMPAIGKGGLVKVLAKKNVAVPHPIHTPRRLPGPDVVSNKYHDLREVTHHEGRQKL